MSLAKAAMRSNRVWHPEKSIALHGGGEEMEGGRGSVMEAPQATSTPVRKIIRRKVPTVDTRGASTRISSSKCKGDTEPERGGQSYDTIEQTRRDSAILACKSLQLAKACTDFCGWLENERLSNYASNRRLGSTSDRVGLQTPAEGCRSTLQSRVGSRYSSSVYGRRHHYEFRHLLDSHEYIEQYRKMYCYTTLTIPPQQEPSIEEGVPLLKEHDVQQVPESFLPMGMKSFHQSDPYLRELASRLGVKESIKEQQLLHSPRPTPPSITKGNRNTEDLVVRANGKK